MDAKNYRASLGVPGTRNLFDKTNKIIKSSKMHSSYNIVHKKVKKKKKRRKKEKRNKRVDLALFTFSTMSINNQ